jgi:hypothetical protein
LKVGEKLRAIPRTLRLRREMKREAALFRSPLRWILLVAAWAAGALVAVATSFSTYTSAFAGVLAFPLAWFGSFAEKAWGRLACAGLLVLAGGYAMFAGDPAWTGQALLICGLGMIGGALPTGLRSSPRGPRRRTNGDPPGGPPSPSR